MIGQSRGGALSSVRPRVLQTGEKMAPPFDLHYVLTKAAAVLTNSKLHPNTGTPNYDIKHEVADISDINTLIPAGVVWGYGGATAPTGWLLCDGAAVSRTTYAALFTAIGTTFGAGNGTTTFNIPLSTDRVPWGAGSIEPLGHNDAGSLNHSHTMPSISTDTGNAAVSGAVDKGYANVSDSGHNHTNSSTADGFASVSDSGHTHYMAGTNQALGGGADLVPPGDTDTGYADVIDSGHRHDISDTATGYASIGDSGHGHSLSGLTDSGHTHSMANLTTTDAFDLVLPFWSITFIIKT